MKAQLKVTLRDALIIVSGSSLLGLGVNLLHPNGIPFVAAEPYETLVPCPVSKGEAEMLEPADSFEKAFVIDARSKEAFGLFHLDGAINVPFDYLDPTPKEVLEELARTIARSGARRVVVYGDGDDPDSGEQLGKEISSFGIRNVFFVRGGARALQEEAP